MSRFTALAPCLRSPVFRLSSRRPIPRAPADRWPQFRGIAALLGTTEATLPATLKLLWTYEAGDAIESSAAIADGVVYVGSADRRAARRQPGRRQEQVEVQGVRRRDRRVVAGGRRRAGLHRRSVGDASRRRCGDRQGGVDVQDRHRDEVVAGRSPATRC